MSDLSSKIIGGFIGIGVGMNMATYLFKPLVNEAKIFQRGEGKPAVMRTYKPGLDGLMVEDLENPGKYKTLRSHLESIPNRAERELENALIKDAAEWYK
jgi:hypothetical protein